MIIADPLFKPLSDRGSFVSLPHPAVSSKLYWNAHVGIFGQRITELLDDTFTDPF